jgi:hypothetical protein
MRDIATPRTTLTPTACPTFMASFTTRSLRTAIATSQKECSPMIHLFRFRRSHDPSDFTGNFSDIGSRHEEKETTSVSSMAPRWPGKINTSWPRVPGIVERHASLVHVNTVVLARIDVGQFLHDQSLEVASPYTRAKILSGSCKSSLGRQKQRGRKVLKYQPDHMPFHNAGGTRALAVAS